MSQLLLNLSRHRFLGTSVKVFVLAILAHLLLSPLSHAQLATELPTGSTVRDVKTFGAVGDGVTDDTQAIRDAIASTFNAWEQIYFPPGTYLVSDEINWQRFLTLRGAGADQTTIRLADNAANYQDPTQAQAVLFCRNSGRNPGNDNTSHSNYIFNMTIDTGQGNPGAIGIDFSSHNGGGVVSVRLVDGGNSLTGLSLERDSPGPALIRDVEVVGFDSGIRTSYGVYSMTFEDITLTDQRVTGFYNGQHNASVRGLVSNNRVPAITLDDGRDYGLLVLLDATLTGGAPEATAIVGNGELFARRVSASGYGVALENGSSRITDRFIEEYSTSPLLDAEGNETTSLDLSVPPTPVVPVEATGEWVNVTDYADLAEENNWAPAIQAAIDAGKRTIYFPNKTHAVYSIQEDIYVRGSVERIVGLYARFEGEGKLITQNEQPLVLEQVRADQGIVHEGMGPLVVTYSLGGNIETRPGAGDIFVEDWCCGNVQLNQTNGYFSQFNNEDTRSPKVYNDGGKMVVLNIKTEQSSQVLHGVNGSQTEILGGLLYPVQATPTEPTYHMENSSFGALHREVGPAYPHFLLKDGKLLDPSFSYGTRFVARNTEDEEKEIEDRIVSVIAPEVVAPGTSAEVTVTYRASEERDVIVVFQTDTSPYRVYKVGKQRISAGSGTLNFTIPIPDTTPVANGAYQFQTFIAPTGKSWNQRLDNLRLYDVDVVVGNEAASARLGSFDKLSLFPNPLTTGTLTLRFGSRAAFTAVSIYDAYGRLIRQLDDNADRIKREDFPAPGLYFITVVGDQRRATQPLLVE